MREFRIGWPTLLLAGGILVVGLAIILILVYQASNLRFGVAAPFRTYPGLIVAMAAGLFGATFSMLIQSQRRTSEGTLEDLNSASAWQTLMVRASVGLGAAAILYFFFRSGLLQGSLWPDLGELSFDVLTKNTAGGPVVPNKNWCLLIIWCFLGGFSETLVPNILAKTEQKSLTT